MKIVTITKSCRRTVNDGNYGSFQFSAEITAEIESSTVEEVGKILYDKVVTMTMEDFKRYFESRKKGETL